MAGQRLFETDNGATFNVSLDAGLCLAMCLDVAKVQLTHNAQGKPTKAPRENELTPGKWAIVQSAYEINASMDRIDIIEAQGLDGVSTIDTTDFDGDFEVVADAITALDGANVFRIRGDGGSHALLWIRDDDNDVYLFLDPNDGLWSFDDAAEAAEFMEDAMSDYDDLDEQYGAFTVTLS